MAGAAAALLPLWAGAGTAYAATGGFPPESVFLIQAETADGTRCATQSDSDQFIRFQACDSSSTNQHWFQQEVDGDGYGMVFGAAGLCINEKAEKERVGPCSKDPYPENRSWKQQSDGTVVSDSKEPGYWAVAGADDQMALRAVSHAGGATEFTMVTVGKK
ncbi:hypothetical protein [Nocardia sp. BMG51109]|uniref:hypothetical protein n=1 Tax=Nocardia sp. BMG51109 TaxID=1056816 RepID=UPI000466E812|nr:hypothetical protein [Nocardia sp. BMG51109]